MTTHSPQVPKEDAAGVPLQRPATPAKRRPRWLRWLLVPLPVLAAFIWSAPYLLGTGAGTRWALSALVNPNIKGRVDVKDLSLSWLGPCRLKGIQVFDPENRSVVDIADVLYPHGLLHAISWRDLGQIALQRPRVSLYVAKDGTISLSDALGSRQPSPPRPAGKAPEIEGDVSLAGGGVEIIQEDGRRYKISEVNLLCHVRQLNDLAGHVDFLTQGQGKINADIALQDLAKNGPVDPWAARGTLKLQTPTAVDITPIGEFLGVPDVKGILAMNADSSLDGGKAQSRFDISLGKFVSARGQPVPAEPVDVKLAGQIIASSETAEGQVRLTGQPGEIDLTFDYRSRQGEPPTTNQELWAAIMEGRPATLPQANANVDGRFDLARLAASVPTLLNIRPDVKVNRGELVLDKIAFQGGLKPSAGGKILLKDLHAVKDGKDVTWAPISLAFAAVTVEGGGLRLDKADLDSGFATVRASGTPADAVAAVQADLAAMHRELGQILDLGGFTLEGKITGSAEAKRLSEKPLKSHIELGLKFDGVQYAPASRGEPIAAIGPATAPSSEHGIRLTGELGWQADLLYDASSVSFIGQGVFTDLDMAMNGRQSHQKSIVLDHDVRSDRKDGKLELGKLQLASAPMNLSVSGSVAGDGRLDFKGSYRAAWAELTPVAAQFMVGLPLTLGQLGTTEGQFRLSGPKQDLAGSFDAKGEIGAITSTGFRFAQGQMPSFDDIVRAVTDGKTVALPEASLKLDAELNVAPIAAAIPQWLGLQKNVTLTTGKARIEGLLFDGGQKPSLHVAASLRDVSGTRGGKAVSLTPLSGQVDIVSTTDGQLRIETMSFTSAFARFQGSGTAVDLSLQSDADMAILRQQLGQFVDVPPISGKVTIGLRAIRDQMVPRKTNLEIAGNADLKYAGSTPSDGSRLTETAIAGKLQGQVGIRRDNATDISAKLGLEEVRLSLGDKRFEQKTMTVAGDVAIDQKHSVMTVKLDVGTDPRLLGLRLAGKVTDLSNTRNLDLSGDYDGQWDQISVMLQILEPNLSDMLTMAGTTGGPVSITGPARHPQVVTAAGEVKGSADVGWGSAKAFGLDLSKARLQPRLDSDQIIVPPAEIPASGGTLRVSGMLDMQGSEPVLKLPAELRVLQNVNISPKFSHQVLSRINPIFANLVSVEGTISARLEGVELPLGEGLKTGGQGRGHVDLSKLKIQPSGLMGALMELGGAGKNGPVFITITGVDFRLQKGGLEYENLRVIFPENYDLIFRGRVGFDDSMNMMVSVPVTAAMLEKLKVKGPLGDYARLLKGSRIDVPLAGSRTKAGVDLTKVNIAPLVEKATKSLLLEQGGKGVGGLLREPSKKS